MKNLFYQNKIAYKFIRTIINSSHITTENISKEIFEINTRDIIECNQIFWKEAVKSALRYVSLVKIQVGRMTLLTIVLKTKFR